MKWHFSILKKSNKIKSLTETCKQWRRKKRHNI